jgi:CMP-N,N'-diacetyllegionaminic acid synthase
VKNNFLQIVLIPARSGSKGIKNKNIKKINNKELIYYTIKSAKQLNPDRIIVSTDSLRIKKIAEKYGAEVPFLRPKKISGDKSTDLECFKHFINWWKMKYFNIPELIYHLRVTSPFRKKKNLIDAKNLFLKNKSYSSLRSLTTVSETPYKMWKIKNNKAKPLLKSNSKKELHSMGRQYLPQVYNHSGYIDIIRTRKTVLKNSMTGKNILAFIPKHTLDYYIDIDKEHDFKKAKSIFFKNFNKKK